MSHRADRRSNGTQLFPRDPQIVAPGAVLVPGWLDPEAQRNLADACRRWAVGGRRLPVPAGCRPAG